MGMLSRLVVLCVALIACDAGPPAPPLSIHFLDVGQGDATLIQSPEGHAVLVDTGPSSRIVYALSDLGVESLDLLLLTHNHADHIAGAGPILRDMPVRYYMDNGMPHTTATYRRLLETVIEVDVPLLEPDRRSIQLGSVTLEILPPLGQADLGQNANSVGVVVVHGEFRAMISGDAEPVTWDYWIASFPDLIAPVRAYKASHHGSRVGDTQEALSLLRPKYAVISVSGSNRYGHPSPEAIGLLDEVGARVLTTAESGTIHIAGFPDGRLTISVEREDVERKQHGSRPHDLGQRSSTPSFRAGVARANPGWSVLSSFRLAMSRVLTKGYFCARA